MRTTCASAATNGDTRPGQQADRVQAETRQHNVRSDGQ